MSGETAVDENSEDVLKRWELSVIKEHVKRIWAAMHGGDPEPSPKDYDPFADERRFYQRLLREHRGGSPGSVIGHTKIIAILMTINIGLTGAVSTWMVSTITKQGEAINEQGRDIAVIKCQIDPKCRLVVSSDK